MVVSNRDGSMIFLETGDNADSNGRLAIRVSPLLLDGANGNSQRRFFGKDFTTNS